MKSRTEILFNSFLIFFLSICISYAHERNKKDLSSFQWKKRILIFNTVSNNESSRKRNEEIKNWVKINRCQIQERNLIVVIFEKGLNSIYKLSPSLRNKRGVWLVGYDGSIKDYSDNMDLLERIMRVVDEMPIRKNEMKNRTSTCDKV